MTIQLNGKTETLMTPVSLLDFLQSKDLLSKPLVIELNGQALLREEYRDHTLEDGAILEIVTLAAGG
ncbi:MAG: sulfur carrier protein ThiS [Akkermansiaceae bacterium]|jgi:thiamine biosynthesis protein ThiS|nr:sulfur carrier protein ThiS [Akkermansiaceae bacterium]